MEGRNTLFWKVLFSLLIMAMYGSCSAAYAAEFGGFDVSTGTGEYEGIGEEWEDEPVYNTPEQNDSNPYADEARNDGQESEQNTSGTVSSYNEEYEQVPVQNWNARESSTTTEKARSSETEYTERYRGGNENVSSSIMDEDRIIESENTVVSLPAETSPTWVPTVTPTPVPAPTATSIPVFTEVPKEEVETVTEYKEEYRLPPAECLRKMKLLCLRRELEKGEYAEIRIKKNAVVEIVSVRVNGQEKDWDTEGEIVRVHDLVNDINLLEIAAMIPADFTWTGEKKNVILTYNVF
nr:hypothetical protein [uncultured Blautia sp.]